MEMVSPKQHLLAHTKIPNSSSPDSPPDDFRPIILFILFILILIAASIILSPLLPARPPWKRHPYLASSTRYYCHLTVYSDLCFDSMSAMVSTAVVRNNPTPIFSTSLQIAVNQSKSTLVSINKAISSTSNASTAAPGLSLCQTCLRDSLSLLRDSLSLFHDGEDVRWLTYDEMDSMKAWVRRAAGRSGKCLAVLAEIDDAAAAGVEEVKVGVERARKCAVNSIGLLQGRDSILYEFYTHEDWYYQYFDMYSFDNTLMMCVYSGMYLFLALLYFLFLRGA